jgi:hypothetical protein
VDSSESCEKTRGKLVSLVKINFTVVLEYLGATPDGISLFGEGERESRAHIRVRKMFISADTPMLLGFPPLTWSNLLRVARYSTHKRTQHVVVNELFTLK